MIFVMRESFGVNWVDEFCDVEVHGDDDAGDDGDYHRYYNSLLILVFMIPEC